VVIYKVTNRINGKVYIGKTVRTADVRWAQHVSDARCGSALLFHLAIRKHGETSFQLEVMHSTEDPDELNRLECAAIKHHRSFKRDSGYNLTLGGEGAASGELNPMFGKTHTAEVKQQLRNLKLGTTHSEATKAKISEANRGRRNRFFGKTHISDIALAGCRKGGLSHLGKCRSLLTKEKISQALKGYKKSQAHCDAISAAKKGKPGHQPSEESRQRMSESRRAWWSARKGL
jgi:group I intron endonuclease